MAKPIGLTIAALTLCAAAGLVFLFSGGRPSETDRSSQVALTDAQLASIKIKVDHFCGDCHATPRADRFPKRQWQREVLRGYDFYFESGRTDLEVPSQSDLVRYFEQLAPGDEEYAATLNGPSPPLASLHFAAGPNLEASVPNNFGVSNLTWGRLAHSEDPVLVFSDMATGEIGWLDPDSSGPSAGTVARLSHPAHVEICDLDRDGNPDVLVADLGSIRATDDACGQVVWLRSLGPGSGYEPRVLQAGIGRTCDVRPADFDGDGDLDLVVAEFGWQKTGGIFWLEQIETVGQTLQFEKHDIDARHGTVNVIPSDLDGDGDIDFTALITQEYELIVAFLNDGTGAFQKRTLYEANGPAYGSSGIRFVDLDGDGDEDLIYVNGDTFDGELVKPYHSIQWLENTGGLEFEHHSIATLPGVHQATAGDVDGDGDIDLMAASLLPSDLERLRDHDQFDSVICLINRGDQTFDRYSLERKECSHPTCLSGDFDGDGDLDLAVGTVSMPERDPNEPRVRLFWNQGAASEPF